MAILTLGSQAVERWGRRVPRETPALRDRRAKKVIQDHKDCRVFREYKDRRENEARQALTVPLAQRVTRATLSPMHTSRRRSLRRLKAKEAIPERRGLKATPALKGLKVKKVIQGHGGHRANKARVAIQDQRETPARQERLAQMRRLPELQLP